MKLNMLLAMIVISSISLSAMEEKELVVAPGKSKEATKQLHECFELVSSDANFQGEKLYSKFEECLKAGADPNAEYHRGYPFLKWISVYPNYPSQSGQLRSPLSLIALLIQYGAEINKKSGEKQTSALHAIVTQDVLYTYETACMLLQCGADINCKDGDGGTPFSRSCYSTRFLKLLLIYGADPFIKDNEWYDVRTGKSVEKREAELRRSICLDLHVQAQALLALKKQKENEGATLKEIQQHFKKADFPYPYRGIATDDSQVFLIRR